MSHVGIYTGVQNGQAVMVDAPHTGADVRVESLPSTIWAKWGTETSLGASAP